MRRVQKEEIIQTAWTQPDGFDECLACWKNWMIGDADRDLGAKTMNGLVGNTDGYGVDSSEAQMARDIRIATATDAMIDSLQRIHRWAIYRTFGIGTAWRFPNADLINTYSEAHANLCKKLRTNFVTSVMF